MNKQSLKHHLLVFLGLILIVSPAVFAKDKKAKTQEDLLANLSLRLLALAVADASAQRLPGEQQTYGYYYKGELVTLTPSTVLVAVNETGEAFRSLVRTQGLERDPLSDKPALRAHNLGLYRLPVPAKGERPIDLHAVRERFARTTSEEIQPVFEQGPALLIPSDEVIVGFAATTTLADAERYLERYRESQGIVAVRAHRANSYIARIDRPANGRVYQVSRFLTKQGEIEFAEPNHIVVFLENPVVPTGFTEGPPPRPQGRKQGSSSTGNSPVSWTTLVEEGFEGGVIPDGWRTRRMRTVDTDAHWSVTNHRARAGRFSAYATGGGTEGIAPPGPYPNDVLSVLDSPILNLAPYEEVYVELWFYAKYQDPASGWCNHFDTGRVEMYDMTSGASRLLGGGQGMLTVCYTGDLTADLTTHEGWRRALFRVPPGWRRDSVRVRFVFYSDGDTGAEGLYIDKVRVVATKDVDTEPIGNDTYGARQYEWKNAGQIAGLGNDNNDMEIPEAWDLVTVSSNIVVAVIDQGVDILHPDLNLDPGYDYDGEPGGHHRGPHGTAVAGNVGAIGDNALGVLGTAPGVRIMSVFRGYEESAIANAIDVAVEKGADILTNSWGWVDAPSASIEAAIKDALDAGRVVLFAAGNGPDRSPWTYRVAFPGNLTGTTDVICVGASSPTDEHKAAASSDGIHWRGSSYVGHGPDVVAPSSWNYTTDVRGAGGYNSGSLIDPEDIASEGYMPAFGGTSSSTPKVAGIVALMLSARPSLTPAEVKRILRTSADDIDAPGVDDKTGAGRVNAYRAVCRAKSYFDLRCLPYWPSILVAVAVVSLTLAWLLRRRVLRRAQ